MADETLQLAAQVVDKFSAPITDMQRQLRLLVDNNRKAHTEGVGLTKVHTEGFIRLREAVMRTSSQLRVDFAPVVEKMGFSLGTVARALTGPAGIVAGLSAMGAAVAISGIAFQNHAQNLTRMKNATGLSIDALRAYEALGPKIGSSSDAMDAGLRSVADRMTQLNHNALAANVAMANAGFLPALRNQILALKDLKPEDQLKKLIDMAEQIKLDPGRGGGIAHEKEFLRYFGLPDNIADYPGQIQAMLARIQTEQGHMSDAAVAAGNQAAEAWDGMKTRLGAVSDYIGSTFVPALNAAYDATAEFLSKTQSAVAQYQPLVEGYLTSARGYFDQWSADFAKTDLGAWLQAQATALRNTDWSGIGNNVGSALIPNFQALKDAISTMDLRGYFEGVWADILASNTQGSGTVSENLQAIRVVLAKDWADIKSDVTAFVNDPMMQNPFKGLFDQGSLFAQVKATLPDWKPMSEDVATLAHTIREVVTVLDDLGRHKIDWALIFDLTGFRQMMDTFEKTWTDRFQRLAIAVPALAPLLRSLGALAAAPSGPAPINPYERRGAGLAPLPGPPPAAGTPGGEAPPSMPAYTPIAWNPDEGSPFKPTAGAGGLHSGGGFNVMPGGGAAPGGASSSTSGAITIIAAGVRKGVYDGLYDFWQMMKGMGGAAGGGGGGAGFMNASFGGSATSGGGGTGGGGGAGAPGAGGTGEGAGSGKDLTDLVTNTAAQVGKETGVDPTVIRQAMEGARQGESSGTRGYAHNARGEDSWGPFQMNRMKAGAFGANFERDTAAERKRLGLGGLEDPRTIPMQTVYMARYIAAGLKRGLSIGQIMRPWSGYHGQREAGAGWSGGGYTPAGGAGAPGQTGGDYTGLNLKSGEAVGGGPAQRGLIELARKEQEREGGDFGVFSALRDRYHVSANPSSLHNQGLAFDATLKRGDYEAGRQRMRAYLSGLGFKEGPIGGQSGDFAIEPGTGNHIHVQFNNNAASERYYALMHPSGDAVRAAQAAVPKQALPPHPHTATPKPANEQDVRREPGSLLRAGQGAGVLASVGSTHKVTGEASLRIKLASGLAPDGGVKNKGSLFKEVRLDRAAPALASTVG